MAQGGVRNVRRLVLAAALLATAMDALPVSDAEYASRRREMVDEITRDQPVGARIGAAVREAMATVPRHLFVTPEAQPYAYENRPLSIGHGQTISQPYIVALMTELLQPAKGHRVLEIGTGSGYQAAVLARLVASVYTIEIVEPLATESRERLARLGFANVQVRAGDGYAGWPEQAPFDGIMVTAGAEDVPGPLLDQLKRGGRMVIPVGSRQHVQHLMLIEKGMDGSVTRRKVLPVRFVPFTRKP
jgi:protein-L-isoaspartate(D-aspartate) O-methyltransferase